MPESDQAVAEPPAKDLQSLLRLHRRESVPNCLRFLLDFGRLLEIGMADADSYGPAKRSRGVSGASCLSCRRARARPEKRKAKP